MLSDELYRQPIAALNQAAAKYAFSPSTLRLPLAVFNHRDFDITTQHPANAFSDRARYR